MTWNKKLKIPTTNKNLNYIQKMLSYCLKCTKNLQCQSPKVGRTENKRLILLSKCAVFNSKKSKFLEEQDP